jgi:predicted nucleotidyltransferase
MSEKATRLSKKLLGKITQGIVEAFDVERIVLFGSFAYGKPRKHSDLDLFIVMKSNQSPSERRIAMSRLFPKREVAMDFIVKTPGEVRERLAMGDFFVQKVLKNGIILYEKKAT